MIWLLSRKKMEEEDVTMLALNHEKYLNLRMLRVAKQEREELRLKSIQLWLKGGDNNTSYFHNQSKDRLSSNTIKEMYDSNGNKIDGNEAVKRHTIQHFINLYTDKDESDPIAQDEILLVIPQRFLMLRMQTL